MQLLNSSVNQAYRFKLRVYFEDTDAGGVVYNANYLKFFERGRSEWLCELGIDQAQLLADGIGFVVKRVEMEHLLPARFNQLLTVHCQVSQMRRTTIIFDQYISDEQGNILCTALFTIACVDLIKMKPVQFPANITEVFKVAS